MVPQRKLSAHMCPCFLRYPSSMSDILLCSAIEQIRRDSMQSGIAKTSPRYLAGMITASLVEICFGTIWGLAAASGRWIAFLPISIMAVGLLAFCITTRQAVRRLPQEQETPEDHVRGRQVSRRYVVVVAAEVLAIAVTVILLRLIKYPAGIAPAICLIVGLHF